MTTRTLPFVNHYAELALPISASRDRICAAYRPRLQKSLGDAAVTAEDERGVEVQIEVRPRVAANEALRSALMARRTVPRTKRGDVRDGGDRLCKSAPNNSTTGAFFPSLEALQSTISGLLTYGTQGWWKPQETDLPPTPSTHTDEIYCHDPPTESIAKPNKLTDAIAILSHPVKKEAYDRIHRVKLQLYEQRRIAEDERGTKKREAALMKAGSWRDSLLYGHNSEARFHESRFGRVCSLKGTSRREQSLLVASGVCGEVVGAFVDGMEI